MNPRNIVTITLLAFVAAALGTVATRNLWQDPVPAAEDSAPDLATLDPPTDGVMVYYFHGTTRCPTCETIERFADEAVHSGFADELAADQLRWSVVDYETPENEHFATDYDVVAPTVVLVRYKAGQPQQHANLMRVWELVGDQPAFTEYVQDELRTMLTKSGG